MVPQSGYADTGTPVICWAARDARRGLLPLGTDETRGGDGHPLECWDVAISQDNVAPHAEEEDRSYIEQYQGPGPLRARLGAPPEVAATRGKIQNRRLQTMAT
jgi:hypothetical protein